MSADTAPVLRFYRRDGCELCDEGRDVLAAILEERAMTSRRVPALRVVDIAGDPYLERRYGHRLPLLDLEGQELPLAVTGRQIRLFLDRVLGGALV